MRFGFDVSDSGEKSQGGPQSVTPPSSIPSSKAEIQWVPLQNHPLFSSTAENVGDSSMPRNLMTWDGASRLYFWDSNKTCLHRISIRLGEPDPGSILAASPSKVFLFLFSVFICFIVCFSFNFKMCLYVWCNTTLCFESSSQGSKGLWIWDLC